MKTSLVALLTRKTVIVAQLMLMTLAAVAVWIINQFDVWRVISSAQEFVAVSINRFEFFLVLILLFLNVAAAYALFRQFNKLNRVIKYSTGLMIISLLVLTVWLGKLFVFGGVSITFAEEISTVVGRTELMLVLVLIFGNMLAGVFMYRRYRHVEEFVVISAYSKKVQYKGRWVTIEEYLQKELGIKVSHGITPEEKEEALREFFRENAPPPPTNDPLPRPGFSAGSGQ